MRGPRRAFRRLFLFAAALGIGPAAFAQDPSQAAPDAFTQKIDNQEVQVFAYSSKAGSKEPMHSHRACVVYILAGGKLRVTTPDGASRVFESRAGDVMWLPPATHSVENIGSTEVKSVIVELKHTARAGRAHDGKKKTGS